MNYEENKWYYGKAINTPFIARFSHTGNDYMLPEMLWFYFKELYFSDGYDGGEHNRVASSIVVGLATPTQIEQCLKAYAEKNGYVEGSIMKGIYSGRKVWLSGKLEYDKIDDSLSFGIYKIYRQGKWAEIVKEEPKSTLTKTEMDTKEEVELPSFRYKTDDLDDVDFHTLRFWIGGKDVHIYELIEVYKLALKFKDVIG